MSVFAKLRALLRRGSTMGGVAAFLAVLGLGALPAVASQLHPGDTVSVIVYNHPDLSTRATVDGSGDVALPLAGTVRAGGVSPPELADRIRTSLSRYIPKVAVEVELVSRTQSIFVSGGPGGVLPYTPGETLSEAIAQLQTPQGSPTNTTSTTPASATSHDLLHGRVDLRQVTIVRDDRVLGPFNESSFRTNGAADPVLMPEDTIRLVDRPIRVEVRGEVREPGTAYLDNGERLSDALNQVGGYVPTSATADILLTRDGREQHVAAGGAEFSAPAQNGDILTVQRAPHIGVYGGVQKPGDVVLTGDTSLLSAVYNAGGPVKHANVSKVLLFHAGTYTTHDITAVTRVPQQPQNAASPANPELHDGDVVFVPEGHNADWNYFWVVAGAAVRWIP